MSGTLSAEDARTLGGSMGLSGAELDHIEAQIGRVPTATELTIFAGMWSEHCSYKSTLHWLRKLPNEGPATLAGPGSHAGGHRSERRVGPRLQNREPQSPKRGRAL